MLNYQIGRFIFVLCAPIYRKARNLAFIRAFSGYFGVLRADWENFISEKSSEAAVNNQLGRLEIYLNKQFGPGIRLVRGSSRPEKQFCYGIGDNRNPIIYPAGHPSNTIGYPFSSSYEAETGLYIEVPEVSNLDLKKVQRTAEKYLAHYVTTEIRTY